MNRSDVNDAFTAHSAFLIILAQATVAPEPGKGTFDDPAAGQDMESDLTRRPFNDLQDNIERFAHPVDATTVLVDAISPDLLQTGDRFRQLEQQLFGVVIEAVRVLRLG
jgi:hypothetical protein